MRIWHVLLVLLAVIVFAVIADQATLWHSWLADEANARTVAGVVDILRLTVTTTGLLIAGLWTYWLFDVKRLRKARGDLTLSASHILLEDSDCLLLRITLALHNQGVVTLTPESGYLKVRQVLPVQDVVDLSEWKDEVPVGETEIGWPELTRRGFSFKDKDEAPDGIGRWSIEPGENDFIAFDILVPSDVYVVRISAFVSETSRKKGELGWRQELVYDTRIEGPRNASTAPPSGAHSN